MLFGKELWERLADGTVTVAYRRWKRPTVTEGGTLRTAVGVLAIDEVVAVPEDSLTEADARQAGYASLDGLRRTFRPGPGRRLHRIAFHHVGADPRERLREEAVGDEELAGLAARLDRLDAAGADGPWTRSLLGAIDRWPGLGSGDLAERLGDDRPRLKRRVRRLKELGLTESLPTGYRISPRGRSAIARLAAGHPADDAPEEG
jgi:hypothetical protein